MKKKYSLIIIAVIMIIMGALAGCGSRNANNGGVDGPVTLKMVYPVAANATADQQFVTNAINEYLEKEINVRLDIEALDGATFSQKLPVMISSRENFDVAWIQSGHLLQNVSRNAFVELDELLDKYGAGIKSAVPGVLLDGVRVKGKLYSLPVYKEYGYGNTFYMRKDIVDKYNIDLSSLKTLGDFEPYLKAIKEGEARIAPFFTQNGAMDVYVPAKEGETYYFNVGGLPDVICYDPSSDRFVSRVDTESYKNRQKIFYSWAQKGYINSDALTVQSGFDDTIKGERGWFVTTSSKPGVEQSLSKTSGTEIIRGYSEKSYVMTSSLMGSMNTVSITSRNPDKAMMFLDKLFTDKKLINLFNFGIEGKHYEKADENTVKLPQGFGSPSETGYAPVIDWRLGNNYNLYLWDYEPKDKWEQYRKFSEESEPEPLLGFFVDTTSVKDQLSMISNVRASYHLPLFVGAAEPEAAIAVYSEKLKEAGINEVIAEAQKQYEEWKLTK
jgi:putative aldouronate transport system substrate-binding protein